MPQEVEEGTTLKARLANSRKISDLPSTRRNPKQNQKKRKNPPEEEDARDLSPFAFADQNTDSLGGGGIIGATVHFSFRFRSNCKGNERGQWQQHIFPFLKLSFAVERPTISFYINYKIKK